MSRGLLARRERKASRERLGLGESRDRKENRVLRDLRARLVLLA